MTWTPAKIIGLTLGILLPILLITLSSILLHRHRTRTPTSPPKPSSPEDPEHERALALPGPIHQPGTIRRATGHPQTFYDWVVRSNEDSRAQHNRFASLEHGPGPIIRGEVPAGHQRRVYTSLENGPRPEIEDVVREEMGRKDSFGGSSLREAVMSAAGTEGKKGEEVKKKEGVVKEFKIESKKGEERSALRGYSGAWP